MNEATGPQHVEFGTEAERPDDADRDYPALIDQLREAAVALDQDATTRKAGDDDTLREVLIGLVDLGDMARKALKHWDE